MTQKVEGLPESIQVGPQVFDIVPTVLLDEEEWGECNYREQTISIDTRLPLYEREVTLFHEWVHVLLRRNGTDAILSPELQEMLCDLIGFGVADLIENGTLELTQGRSPS